MSNWISVSDRLPNEWESVLVFPSWQSGHEYSTAYCFNHSSGDLHWSVAGTTSCRIGKTITHWMPLPEPPEES